MSLLRETLSLCGIIVVLIGLGINLYGLETIKCLLVICSGNSLMLIVLTIKG